MNLKVLVNSFVGIGLAALIAWKGASVEAAIVAFLVAACVLVGVLHILPPGAQAYVDALEAALEQNAPEAAKRFVKKTFVIFFVVGAMLAAATSTACTPAATPILVSQLPADAITDVGCVVADMISGTQLSIGEIIAQCASNLLPAQAAQLLAALEQGGGIAVKIGPSQIAHVPQIVVTESLKARFATLQASIGGSQ